MNNPFTLLFAIVALLVVAFVLIKLLQLVTDEVKLRMLMSQCNMSREQAKMCLQLRKATHASETVSIEKRSRVYPLPLDPRPRDGAGQLVEGEKNEHPEFVTLFAQSQVMFRPERLVLISPEDLDDLEVLDITVGKNSQIAAPNPLIASVFGKDVPTIFKFDTAQVSQFVKVKVQRRDKTDKKPLEVYGTFFGTAVE